MKKIFFSSLIAASMLTGCSGFLDENPKSGMPEEEAYKSSTLAYLNTVASVYSGFNSGGNGYIYGATDNIHYLQEFSSDAWILPGRGADWVDGGKHQSMFLHNYDTGHDTVQQVWNNIYRIIGLCNSSIDKLKEIYEDTGEDFVLEYIDEVRALRAIWYYYAVDLYGRIPIVTSSSMSVADVNQSSRSEAFQFIVEELADCIPNLASAKCQNSGLYYGRITKAVGYMAMAKMALNSPIYTTDNWNDGSLVGGVDAVANTVTEKGKNVRITLDGETRNAWETVLYCHEQIKAEGYALQDNFSYNFSSANTGSVENIWTMPRDASTYIVQNYNTARTLHQSHTKAIGVSEGWNGACSTVQQMNVFGYGTPNPDPRLDMTFFYGVISVGGEVLESGLNDDKPLEYQPMTVIVNFDPQKVDDYTLKMAGARMAKYEIDLPLGGYLTHNVDIPVWRYADLLLMVAEAKIRLGQSGDTEVNQIRARVNASAKSNVSLQDILDERMLELSYEGHRRQDQVRFGTYTEHTVDRYPGVEAANVAGNYVDDKTGYTTVFPIPQTVRELNPNLAQNPGYN